MTAPRTVWIVAWPDGTLGGPYRSEAEAESYRGRWPTSLAPAVIRYEIAGSVSDGPTAVELMHSRDSGAVSP